jgi:hypothetical protein
MLELDEIMAGGSWGCRSTMLQSRSRDKIATADEWRIPDKKFCMRLIRKRSILTSLTLRALRGDRGMNTKIFGNTTGGGQALIARLTSA